MAEVLLSDLDRQAAGDGVTGARVAQPVRARLTQARRPFVIPALQQFTRAAEMIRPPKTIPVRVRCISSSLYGLPGNSMGCSVLEHALWTAHMSKLGSRALPEVLTEMTEAW